MAKLKIYEFPNPVLAQKAKPIQRVDRSYFSLADDLLETMYSAPGAGLAAPQVGILERMIVIDVYYEREEASALTEAPSDAEIFEKYKIWNKKQKILINPEILSQEGSICFAEGCLSVPEYRGKVNRAKKIRIRYQDLEGRTHEEWVEDYEAVAVQHELDHLNGVLFIDYLSTTKKNQIRKQLQEKAELESLLLPHRKR